MSERDPITWEIVVPGEIPLDLVGKLMKHNPVQTSIRVTPSASYPVHFIEVEATLNVDTGVVTIIAVGEPA